MRKSNTFLLVGVVTLFLGMRAHANLVSATGAGQIVAADASVGYKADFFNSPNNGLKIYAWNEKQNVLLPSNFKVDIVNQGTYQSPFASANAVMPTTQRVNSHYIYFDPKNSKSATGTFTFDTPIVAIILSSGSGAANDHLLASDFLIPGTVPSANIPTSHFNARGVEFGPEKVKWLSANTIDLNLTASSPGDQIRVLTQAVPEPATIFAVASGLAFMLKRKRK